ncbi:hypothetical protein [Kutzneria sp. 744]|uniref:RCC1 domain-containing protein n=1 Tax=Kutzneria sp. (strain 744) TaxID=345341 RepID=UPI0012FB7F18|nr:hypothetical protein [Kutzneria sp. 744]
MSFARIGALGAAMVVVAALGVPAAQGATGQGPAGLSFTPVSPTRLLDTRATGHRIEADHGLSVNVPTGLVPADAVAVVVNLTGTDAAGPTFLQAGRYNGNTSNLNLVAGETRANLVTVTLIPGQSLFELSSGPNALDAIVDVAGYYSAGGASKFTPVAPKRVLDTRDSGPVGPQGTVTVDLSGQVPAGATAAVFNLTGTDVTGDTFVTAYPAGQQKPDASNLNLVAGQTAPNLVTVALSPDRKVTLANAYSTVDLIADLAGYYSPQSTQAFYPMSPIRVLDTRYFDTGASRSPLGNDQTRRVRIDGWLPPGATAAVFNLTATNVSAPTYVSAWPDGAARSAASNLNLVAGQTAANLVITSVSADRAIDLYNHTGQLDPIVDLAGYFAPAIAPCTADCVLAYGDNSLGQQGDGTTDRDADFSEPPHAVYGLDHVTATATNGADRYALRSDGTVWSWGLSHSGELGIGLYGAAYPDTVAAPYSTIPVQVPGLPKVAAIDNTMALGTDGSVWTWGENRDWQLGNGSTDEGAIAATPVRVAGLTNVIGIAADYGDRYAVKADGTVWAWGANFAGDLGTGVVPEQSLGCLGQTGLVPDLPNCGSAVPVQVAGLTGVTKIGVRVAVKSDGTVWRWGRKGSLNTRESGAIDPTPVQVPGLSTVVALAHAVSDYAVKADGTVWAWGEVTQGSTGQGFLESPYNATPAQVPGVTGVTGIAASDTKGYALKSDGTVIRWGGGPTNGPAAFPGLSGVTALGVGGLPVGLNS